MDDAERQLISVQCGEMLSAAGSVISPLPLRPARQPAKCPRQRVQTGNLRGIEEHRIVGVDAKADQTMLNPHQCAVTA